MFFNSFDALFKKVDKYLNPIAFISFLVLFFLVLTTTSAFLLRVLIYGKLGIVSMLNLIGLVLLFFLNISFLRVLAKYRFILNIFNGISKIRMYISNFMVFFTFAIIEFLFLYNIKTFIITLLIIAILLIIILNLVYKYYKHLNSELNVEIDSIYFIKPAIHRAFVFVSKFNKPTIRAISYAKATNPNLEIITVVNKDDENRIYNIWKRLKIPVPLRVIVDSKNDFSKSIEEFITAFRKINQTDRNNENDLITVYLPHYVEKHRFEKIFKGFKAEQLVKTLNRIPSLIICSVPYLRD